MLLTALTFSNLRGQIFEEGKSFVSVGYGIVGFSNSFFNDILAGSEIDTRNFGPVYFKYEYAISEKLGIGIGIANVNNSYTSTGTYTDNMGVSRNYTEKLSRSNTSILARLNWHFGENDRFDPYFGFGMGYRFGGWKYTVSDPAVGENEELPTVIPFGFELTTGARYFFTDNFGIYGEVGLAKSILQFGLTANF
jgi:opacity protein-like surface antigen